MTLMLSLMITSLAINMFLMMNPLSMGVSILLMALLTAMLFSYSMSSWIAFLIFLIYIGGMLVMFSYFVSLTPNQTINMMSMIMMISMTYSTLFILTTILSINTQSTSWFSTQSNMFYLKQNSAMLMILALILLITMIIVVKLTTTNKGPLRPFMAYV